MAMPRAPGQSGVTQHLGTGRARTHPAVRSGPQCEPLRSRGRAQPAQRDRRDDRSGLRAMAAALEAGARARATAGQVRRPRRRWRTSGVR